MYARNKVVLNHAHSGWIDVETVLKATNSEWRTPADFAEQRRNEGFLVRYVTDSELSGWLMRWDDAYDWIYRYASPVRARDILERALNIEKVTQDVAFEYPLYDFLRDSEDENDVSEIFEEFESLANDLESGPLVDDDDEDEEVDLDTLSK